MLSLWMLRLGLAARLSLAQGLLRRQSRTRRLRLCTLLLSTQRLMQSQGKLQQLSCSHRRLGWSRRQHQLPLKSLARRMRQAVRPAARRVGQAK